MAPIERKRRCGLQELFADDLLNAQVQAEDECTAALRQARLLRALDTGLPVAVDVDEAGHVARQFALRIDAMLGSAELDARQPELEHGLLLLGRDPVFDPGEATRFLEPTLQLGGVDTGQDRSQAARRPGLVDEP